MDDYAPRSPDLSALGSVKSCNSHRRGLHSTSNQYGDFERTEHSAIKQDSFPTLSQSSHYQPPVPIAQHTSSLAHMQTSNPPFSLKSYPTPYPQSTQFPYHRFDIQVDDHPQLQPSHPESYGGVSTIDAFGKKMSGKGQQRPEPEPRPPAPGDAEGIIVKTKFPVARIKRIVQADEEVGKVAQATPVAVGKALELFMIQMTLSATAEANARGSKRLAAPHIKAAISRDDKFDFLKDIGDKIPDDPSTGRRRAGGETKSKTENNSEEDIDMESEEKGRKKLRAGKRRKGLNDG